MSGHKALEDHMVLNCSRNNIVQFRIRTQFRIQFRLQHSSLFNKTFNGHHDDCLRRNRG